MFVNGTGKSGAVVEARWASYNTASFRQKMTNIPLNGRLAIRASDGNSNWIDSLQSFRCLYQILPSKSLFDRFQDHQSDINEGWDEHHNDGIAD